MPPKKHIIFIHGRDTKPAENELKKQWYDTVTFGLKRDFGSAAEDQFKEIKKTFIYYGNFSNEELKGEGAQPDSIKSRIDCLDELKKLKNTHFTKSHYKKIRDKYGYKETLATLLSAPMNLLGLGAPVVEAFAKDMALYWDNESHFGSDVRWSLTSPLAKALKGGDQIFLVAHSLGTMISLDVLWKFTHYAEYRNTGLGADAKVDSFVTLGCPLGDEIVKDHQKGADSKGERKYPHNIRQWINISAEDDFISHDIRIKNDYKQMLKLNLINSIVDHKIYNLAVRNKKSNPHSSTGYLIHPKFIKALNAWL